MGADGINGPKFIELAGDAAEGAYASGTGAPKDAMPSYADFAAKFETAYKIKPDQYAPYTYDATNVLIQAMKDANSIDPAVFLPKVAAINYQGVIGPIAFEATGDIKNGAVTLYQAQGGAFKEMK